MSREDERLIDDVSQVLDDFQRLLIEHPKVADKIFAEDQALLSSKQYQQSVVSLNNQREAIASQQWRNDDTRKVIENNKRAIVELEHELAELERRIREYPYS